MRQSRAGYRHRRVTNTCRYCDQPYEVACHRAWESTVCFRPDCRRQRRQDNKARATSRRGKHREDYRRAYVRGAAEGQTARCPSCGQELTFDTDMLGRLYQLCACGIAATRGRIHV